MNVGQGCFVGSLFEQEANAKKGALELFGALEKLVIGLLQSVFCQTKLFAVCLYGDITCFWCGLINIYVVIVVYKGE